MLRQSVEVGRFGIRVPVAMQMIRAQCIDGDYNYAERLEASGFRGLRILLVRCTGPKQGRRDETHQTKQNDTAGHGCATYFIKQDDRRDKWLKLDSRGDLHHPVSTALKESTKALVSDGVVVDGGERSLERIGHYGPDLKVLALLMDWELLCYSK
jgi:hypothetical protein